MANEFLTEFLGVLSGVLSVLAYLPYACDTWLRRTQPKRASWLIWSILSCISFFSLMYEGASTSLWLVGAQAISTTTIFLLSLTHGAGGFMRGADALVLLSAAAGLGLWALTDTAVYALLISVSISALGGWVTILKSFRYPRSETPVTWAISLFAALLVVVAVGPGNWVLLVYPMYLVTLNAAILLALYLGAYRGYIPAK